MTQVVNKIYKNNINTSAISENSEIFQSEGSMLPKKLNNVYRYSSLRQKEGLVSVKSYSH